MKAKNGMALYVLNIYKTVEKSSSYLKILAVYRLVPQYFSKFPYVEYLHFGRGQASKAVFREQFSRAVFRRVTPFFLNFRELDYEIGGFRGIIRKKRFFEQYFFWQS